jgi:type 2 lantibiotic biosynthesis protein LanM
MAIAGKATSLWERLDGTCVPSPASDPKEQKKIDARLKEWADVVAEGDQELFEKRLAYDGLNLHAIRPLLGDVELTRKLPTWTELLNPVLERSAELEFHGLHERFPCLVRDAPLPFEEILLPFVLTAREMLGTPEICDLLTGKARADLERFLLIRMSDLSSRVLELEFNAYMACLQFTGITYNAASRDKTSRKHYLDFVRKLCTADLSQIFKEYPVLARRLAVRLDQWVQLAGEFVARLRTDLADISKILFEGKDIGKVTDLEAGLSDSHRQGRTVIAVTFESGDKLVYKPKEMGLEADYFQLADWLNTRGSPLNLKVLKVLNRVSYGWVEFVGPFPMKDEAQARRFYERSGMLLCLIYVCDGIDFHNENVSACGEHPVPIDLETIFHHRVRFSGEIQELIDAAKEKIGDSVLRTHFLPSFFQIEDKYLDISGIGGGAEEIVIDLLRWKHINTDAMEYNHEKTKAKATNEMNIPRLKDKPLRAEAYAGHLAEGFRQMHRFLASQKEALLSDTGLLVKMLRNDARFIFRPTALYMSIERKVAHPDYQKEGVDLSLQIDILSRSLIPTDEKSPLWPLLHEETKSMWEMDVPKFMVPGDSDSIVLGSGEEIRHCFSRSPLEHVKEKVRGMNEADMQWQAKLIKGSLEYRMSSKVETSDSAWESAATVADVPLLDKDQLLQCALLLAREIGDEAILSRNGEPSWVVLKVFPNSKQRMLQSMDFHLYDGVCGVALFLAALEKLAPGSGFGDMASASLGPMVRWLNKSAPRKLMETSIGGCCGLPSMVYSLVHLSDFLKDPALLECAGRAASLIERKDIDADKSYDVIGGAAGTALALLPLYKRTGNRQVLETAVYCGEHLLRNRTGTHKEFRIWKTLENSPPLAGFAHGAAGIAYALVALHRETRRMDFLDAAREAMMFETDLFDSNEKNWPDRRVDDGNPQNDAPEFMCAWCQGAAGIGLARVGGLDVIDSPAIRHDIQAALQTTLQFPFQDRDHVCCGNAGRAETLLTAGIALSETRWIDGAKSLTSTMIAKARRNGRFRAAFDQDFYNPSLYQGNAGLGFQFLRLAEPGLLPSLALFE